MKYLCLILALAFGAVIAPVEAAKADTLVWKVRSKFPYKVYIKFFSQDRNNVWPSADRAWVLDDSKYHTFRLRCQRGEKICYGAGTDSQRTVWGVGPKGENGCSSCCQTCGNHRASTTLTR